MVLGKKRRGKRINNSSYISIWQVRAVTSAMLDGDEEIGGRTGEGVPCLIVFAAALT